MDSRTRAPPIGVRAIRARSVNRRVQLRGVEQIAANGALVRHSRHHRMKHRLLHRDVPLVDIRVRNSGSKPTNRYGIGKVWFDDMGLGCGNGFT